MSFFTNAKISVRIGVALVAPIFGLLMFSGLGLLDRNEQVNNLGKVQALAELAPIISGLVHEMQKERGASAGFIGSNGKKFANILPSQQKETNAKRQAMDEALDDFTLEDYSSDFQQKVATARKALSELDKNRQAISAHQLTVPEMAKYYTGTIRKFLTAIEEMAVLSTDAQVTQRIAAYTSVLQGKERAGVERAMGASGFGAGKFAPAIYNNFIGLIAQQDAFFAQFHVYATKEQRSFFSKTLSGRPIDEVDRMRKLAIDSPQTGNLGGVDGPSWFKTITDKINLMKKIEDHAAEALVATARSSREGASGTFLLFLITTLVLVGITAVLVTYIVRGITGPIGTMTGAMKTLADGDKTVNIPGVGRGDEIGGMAEAVQVFKDNMIKAEELSVREAEAAERRQQRAERIEKLTQDFDVAVSETLHAVTSSSTQMENTASSMSGIANDTNQRATSVAAAAEQASANVQTVATATEELSASIQEIARQVSQSSTISGRAVEEAQKTDQQVQGLASAAEKIGEVVSLISDIAEQTNLLALNATIEAARAGEAGKGFAVVASEVKNLASQTAQATEDISRQIGEIQGETQTAVVAIQGIGSIINEINEIASAIASAVEEQGAATQEIAHNVEQASTGTQEVSSNIAEVTRAAGETGDASQQVTGVARDLNQKAVDLKTQVDTFLSDVRAV